MAFKFKSVLKRLAHDKRGNVAMMFGLALLPVLGMAGAALDYSQAVNLQAKLSAASDAAALAAAKSTGTFSQREALAQQVFKANVGNYGDLVNVSFKLIDKANGVRVEVKADQKNSVVSLLGYDNTTVVANSEVAKGEGFVEVSLVLDNTGSMANDMDALRKSSKSFVDTLFASGASSDSLKISVVPYVAAVNPGKLNMPMAAMDTGANSKWHGQILKNRTQGFLTGCNPNPNPSGGGGGGGGGGDPDPGPGDGGDGAWLPDLLNKFGAVGHELFGIKSAAAQSTVTPNTKAPLAGEWKSPGKPYVQKGEKGFVPTGFNFWSPCWLGGPDKVSHFDLFDRIPGAKWKGCVEARPEPYDVTDDVPTGANPDTQFVPYFWPDERGPRGSKAFGMDNSYMDDGAPPAGWEFNEWNWEAMYNLFKYNGVNKADFDEVGPSTTGPNKGCPDELLRLSSDKSAIQAKLAGMKHWDGGGTISSEGVMWGWRTLTPKGPFADGKAYGKAKKFLVVMSDGQNMIGGNDNNGPTISKYGAYGYIRYGRFAKETFSEAGKYFDKRMALACTNAKAAGITVMSIMFREQNMNAKKEMENCASSKKLFYFAKDQNDLQRAFDDVAAEIGKLRITR
ncbi:MAG: TadE/TadG family type IV pilus assembly protein [Bosea sp. (in: a-proteobacteria)]